MNELGTNALPPPLPVEALGKDSGHASEKWAFMGYKEAAAITFSFFVLQVIFAGLGAIPLAIYSEFISEDAEFFDLFSHPAVLGTLNTIACIPLLIWGYRRSRARLHEALGLHAFSYALIPVLIPLAFGSQVLACELGTLISRMVTMPNFDSDFLSSIARFPIAAFLVLVVVAPVTEELVFRGIVYRGLRKRKSTRAATLFSAAMFSILHLDPTQMAPVFCLGLVLAHAYERSQSVGPCMLLHAFFNLLAYVGMMAMTLQGEEFIEPTTPTFLPFWLQALGALLFVAGFVMFNRNTRAGVFEGSRRKDALSG
jgi:uncharacterized protein